MTESLSGEQTNGVRKILPTLDGVNVEKQDDDVLSRIVVRGVPVARGNADLIVERETELNTKDNWNAYRLVDGQLEWVDRNIVEHLSGAMTGEEKGSFYMDINDTHFRNGATVQCALKVEGTQKPIFSTAVSEISEMDESEPNLSFSTWRMDEDQKPGFLIVPFDPNFFTQISADLSEVRSEGGEVN